MTADDAPADEVPADVRAALSRAFPGRPVESVEPLGRGHTKRTVAVEVGPATVDRPSERGDDRDRVVLQTAPADPLRTEATLCRAIRARTDVPVPAVLDGGELSLQGEECEGDGTRGYLVTERVDGVDLHGRFTALDPRTRRRLARSFGRVLGRLHEAFAFDGHGPLAADGDWAATMDRPDPGELLRAEGDERDWPTGFRAYAKAGLDALPAPLAELRAPVREAVEDADLPENPPAKLYPWDLRPGNALVEEGDGGSTRLAAVLDWGDPRAAAPGLAVAKTEHVVCDWYVADGRPLRAAFREGYREVRELPSVPRVYRLVAVVRSAVDAKGEVTRPGYPEREGSEAVGFHRERLRAALDGR